MIIPKWVPAAIANCVIEYEREFLANTQVHRADGKQGPSIREIWVRLATRPEMEVVWNFISSIETPSNLTANGGLLGIVNRKVRSYATSPKLTPTGYKEELQEIAKAADGLARKLRKFTAAGEARHNPFPLDSLLTDAQLRRAGRMIAQERVADGGRAIAGALNYWLPQIDDQLVGLAARARAEASDQFHRVRLPRKVNDKNTFRTYFIHAIADYFFKSCADYSPTRISIFCSVALDDADITADLVAKLCPLDSDQKAMLRLNRSNVTPED